MAEKLLTRGRSCQSRLRRQQVIRRGTVGRKKNVRFPYIHKSEGVDFHLSKILPLKNQVAVPSWRELQAIL